MILLLISLSKQKESENSESYKSLLGKIKADDELMMMMKEAFF